MSVLAVSFLVSFLIILWVLRYGHWHARFTADSDLSGIQKFHTVAVPRIGGFGIFLGMLLALGVRYFENTEVGFFWTSADHRFFAGFYLGFNRGHH